MTDVREQPPPSFEPAANPPSSGRRLSRTVVLAVVGGLAVLLLIGAGAVAVTRLVSGPGTITAAGATTPQKASDGYYQALEAKAPRRAFDLLCAARQAAGYGGYSTSVSQDVTAGTGIKTWTRTAPPRIAGDQAAVAGHLVLDNGQATAITVVLLHEAGGWRVCDSNLGGILPGTGPNSSGPGSNA